MSKYFFLVQDGTNVRVVGRDEKAVQVIEEKVDRVVEHYSQRMPSPLGPIVAISVDDYYNEFVLPQILARKLAEDQADGMIESMQKQRAELGVSVEV